MGAQHKQNTTQHNKTLTFARRRLTLGNTTGATQRSITKEEIVAQAIQSILENNFNGHLVR